MDELHLRIAGIPLRVSCSDLGPREFLESYFAEADPHALCFRAALVDRIGPPMGSLLYDQPSLRVYRDGDRLLREQGGTAAVFQRSILQENGGTLEFRRDKMPQGITGKQLLNAMDLPHILTAHDGFLLHASFIEHAGQAILFTAPSGTGKSTQARLWCDHMGAELVNGDRAAVRLIDGEVCACGIPFSGSSPVRRNVTLPLKAIVYLSQAPENSITKLRGVRAFRRVWEGCTVNTWDRADVEKATKTVTEVITRVPVYHLACTPDERAVELLKHTMEVEQ